MTQIAVLLLFGYHNKIDGAWPEQFVYKYYVSIEMLQTKHTSKSLDIYTFPFL